jgi:hypothetical protein
VAQLINYGTQVRPWGVALPQPDNTLVMSQARLDRITQAARAFGPSVTRAAQLLLLYLTFVFRACC